MHATAGDRPGPRVVPGRKPSSGNGKGCSRSVGVLERRRRESGCLTADEWGGSVS